MKQCIQTSSTIALIIDDIEALKIRPMSAMTSPAMHHPFVPQQHFILNYQKIFVSPGKRSGPN